MLINESEDNIEIVQLNLYFSQDSVHLWIVTTAQ